MRNLTSHTYEEDIARDVYKFIVKNYGKIFDVIVKISDFKSKL